MQTTYRAFSILILLSLLLSAVCTPGAAAAPVQTSGPQDPYEPDPARPLYGVAGVEAQMRLDAQISGLYSADADQIEQPRITSEINYPGSAVVFQKLDMDQLDWDLYLHNADGSERRLFNTTTNEIQPRLNRGSTKVVYVKVIPAANNSSIYEIYSFDLVSGTNTPLTSFNQSAINPNWSPDGSRIVFESYHVGNQGEIYVMNADGSNITRLTFNEGDVNTDYDGMPAWSPDGSQIAFISKRSGGYRVWVMNADGGSQRELSYQPYSAHPTWSGDGNWIAYDADQASQDGYQEPWKMRPDGSQQEVIRYGNGSTDNLVGSFSPLGHWLTGTSAWYVFDDDGNPYIHDASVFVMDIDQDVPMWNLLFPGNFNWGPDWKTTDLTPPMIWINPLPAVSPAPVAVEYGCNDAETGIYFCNLMVRDGPDGAWQLYDPTNTSLLGGHSYYFRVDAMDKGANINLRAQDYDTFTKIEDQPPLSKLEPLEASTENTSVILHWSGYDLGGSGIASYHLQYQDPDTGIWADYGGALGRDVQATVFTGVGGKTYKIRLAAVDLAQNVEPWDESQVISTTLASRRIEGVVRDAWGAPLSGAELAYNVEPVLSWHTDDGRYHDLFGQEAETFSLGLQVSHPDYGGLPEKVFGLIDDLRFDVYLPPAQNSILNPGFEAANTPTDWAVGGNLQPRLNTQNSHSGANSVYLGMPTTFTYQHLYDASDPQCGTLVREMDPAGNIHLLYKCFNNSNLFSLFHRVYRNGEWSAPEEVVPPGFIRLYQALFSAQGDILVFYGTQNQAYYRQYAAGQGWRARVATQTPYEDIYDYVPEMVYDHQGVLHRAHFFYGDNTFYIDYSKMGRDGTWTPTERLGPLHLIMPFIAVDEYDHPFIQSFNQFFAQTPESAWLPLKDTGFTVTGFFMSKDRKLYLKGSRSENYVEEEYYALWEPRSGSFLKQAYLVESINEWAGSSSTLSDSEGNLTFLTKFYTGGWGGQLFYTAKPAGQPARKQILLDSQYRGSVQGAVDSEDNLDMYLVTADGPVNAGGDLDYILRKPVRWAYYEQEFTPCAVPSPVTIPNIYIDAQDRIHLLSKAYDCMEEIVNTGTADATLSQVVTVPPAEESPVLSFMYEPTRTSGPGSPFSVQVIDGSQTTSVFTPLAYRTGWQHAAVDMSPWGGRTVTIQFKVQENAGAERTGIYLDEVSLGPVHPDVYLPGSSRDAQPGSQVTFSMAYGNQGGAPANGTQLELTLPAGLSYVSASIEPVETSPALKWNLGDLASRSSGVFSITLAVAAEVPLGVELSAPLSISTARELQTWNNAGSLLVFTGHRVYMPVLRK